MNIIKGFIEKIPHPPKDRVQRAPVKPLNYALSSEAECAPWHMATTHSQEASEVFFNKTVLWVTTRTNDRKYGAGLFDIPWILPLGTSLYNPESTIMAEVLSFPLPLTPCFTSLPLRASRNAHWSVNTCNTSGATNSNVYCTPFLNTSGLFPFPQSALDSAKYVSLYLCVLLDVVNILFVLFLCLADIPSPKSTGYGERDSVRRSYLFDSSVTPLIIWTHPEVLSHQIHDSFRSFRNWRFWRGKRTTSDTQEKRQKRFKDRSKLGQTPEQHTAPIASRLFEVPHIDRQTAWHIM